ncbi:unnamed protein product [Lota lota]
MLAHDARSAEDVGPPLRQKERRVSFGEDGGLDQGGFSSSSPVARHLTPPETWEQDDLHDATVASTGH